MTLKDFRNELDIIDDEIIRLIVKRLEISRDIGFYKGENSLPTNDEERINEVLKRGRALAGKEYERDSDEVLKLLISQSCRLQENLKEK